MRAFRVLFLVSGVLITAGILALIPPTPVVGTRNVTLDPGYYYYVPIKVAKAGQISGTFSEASGKMVRIYVFDSGQFNTLQNDGDSLGLFETENGSGTFSAGFQIPGSYYLVIRHGSGLEQTNEAVSLSFRIDGENLTVLGSGIASILGGVVLWTVGTRRKRADERRVPGAQDVVMFNQPMPQQPPSANMSRESPAFQAQTQPYTESQSDPTKTLRDKLARLEEELQRMDAMRTQGVRLNLEHFEKVYSAKREEAAEIRRKLGSPEPLVAP